jgi:hypothetical protein
VSEEDSVTTELGGPPPGTQDSATAGGRRSPGAVLAFGVVIVVLAMVFFAAARLVAGSQRHAYDRRATPPPTYHLSAGRTYQLSSADSVKTLIGRGALNKDTLSCSTVSTDGVQQPLTIDSTITDDRSLHLFATFRSAITGDVHVTCASIGDVFVDDADDAATDWSGALVLLSTLLGVLGVIVMMSGAYAYQNPRASR